MQPRVRPSTRVTAAFAEAGRKRGFLALVAGFVVLAAVATAVSAFDATRRADSSPIVPPGWWHVALQLAILIAFSGYVLALLAIGRSDLSLRWAVGVGAAIQAFPLLGPILLSTDVHMYASYGRTGALDGVSPYVESSTNQLPSVYGPLFTLGSELIALLTQDSESTAVFVYRVGAVAAVLAVGLLASRLVKNRALAIALVTWNPLIAFHFGGGGHNDALMVAVVLMALVLGRHEKLAGSGALWAASSSIKLLTIALIPIEALALWRRNGFKSLLRFMIGFAATLLGIIALASIRYGTTWFEAIRTLSDVGSRRGSIGLSRWLNEAGVSEGNLDRVVTLAQFGTFGVLSVAAARTGHARLGLAATLLALLQGWLNPWYAIWGLGLAAADDHDRVGRILAVALCAYLLRDVTTW